MLDINDAGYLAILSDTMVTEELMDSPLMKINNEIIKMIRREMHGEYFDCLQRFSDYISEEEFDEINDNLIIGYSDNMDMFVKYNGKYVDLHLTEELISLVKLLHKDKVLIPLTIMYNSGAVPEIIEILYNIDIRSDIDLVAVLYSLHSTFISSFLEVEKDIAV